MGCKGGRDVCINRLGRILLLLLYHVTPPYTYVTIIKINPLSWIRYNNEMEFKWISTECEVNLLGYTRTHTRFIGFNKIQLATRSVTTYKYTPPRSTTADSNTEWNLSDFFLNNTYILYTTHYLSYSVSNRLWCFKFSFFFSVSHHLNYYMYVTY